MKYTGPKMKRVRREQINLFGNEKYDIKKRRALPGKTEKSRIGRYSEYGKLLRNKQVTKRSYLLSEKQFSKIVKTTALRLAKTQDISHDQALFQLLERRADVIVLRSGLAKSIMQARQMVNHGLFFLNGVKHNIPSTTLSSGDKLQLKAKYHNSPLVSDARTDKNLVVPSRIKTDKKTFTIEVVDLPNNTEIQPVGDLLKVIEFYARV